MALVVPTSEESDNVTGVTAPSSAYTRSEKGALYKRYCMNVQSAEKWRSSERYDDTWKRLRDIYRLRMLKTSDQDQIAVAIAFATINVIAPSVAVNHPKVVVWPSQEGNDAAAKATIVEAIVNYWWRHLDIRAPFRSAVKDFLVYGHGWLKVGYRYEEAEREIAPERLDAAIETQIAEADQYAADNPDLAGDLPTDDEIAASVEPTETVPEKDGPFVERVSPFDVFVDPESTSILDAQWIAQRVVRPLEDVKTDEEYDKSVRRKLNADGTLKWHNEDNKDGLPQAERITLWEFYDLANKTMCVFHKQGDKGGFLIPPQPMPYVYGQPFVMLRNYEVPDQFYPIGEIEAIEPLQDELNDTRSAMVGARRLDIPKFLYRKDAFGSKGLDALSSPEPFTGVPVEGTDPLGDVLVAIPRNDAQPQLYMQHSEVIESDIDRVTGVNEYMRGALPEIRRTATEASIIQDAANARAADKLSQIEAAIAEVARRLVSLGQQYMTVDQVARVIGNNGQAVLFSFTRDDIEGEYDFDVEAGSTQPQNESFRRQSAMQLLQTLQPFVDPTGMGGVINVPALLTRVLRDGFGIKDPTSLIQQAPMIDPATGLPLGPEAAPSPDGGEMPMEEMPPEEAGYGQPPPEIMAQLQGQVGLDLPGMMSNG